MNLKELFNINLFKANYQNSHSYRIPTLLKLKSGKLIAIVDQRLNSQLDAPYSSINQVIRESFDNGRTWSEAKIILKLEKFSTAKASAIDSVTVQDIKNNYLYLAVDIFPGGSGLMPLCKELNPLCNSDLGYTKDKYLKLYDLYNNNYILRETTQKFIYQAFLLKDKNFNNTNESNLVATKIYVDKSFNSKTSLLKGSVYENIDKLEDLNNKKPICSIWDGFENSSKEYKKPKYFIDSTAYIQLFVSKDDGLSWELINDITAQIRTKNSKMNCLVLGPGQGLYLQNQINKYISNKIIFPFYEVNYAFPFHVFVSSSDDNGMNWTNSTYLNSKTNKNWFWTSETQLIELSNGKILAFLRNPNQDHLCISQSIDGGISWSALENNNESLSLYKIEPLNSQIMHGISTFSHNNIDYVLLSLPTTKDRKNGKIFVFDANDFNKPLAKFDVDKDNYSFGYSTIAILEKNDKKITFALLYECSQIKNAGLDWVGFNSDTNTDKGLASEILYKVFELTL
ncbi:exo-alpha-sialidase [Mycoplasmopsis alligatoris]|uniref:exo-alpha-sialidase n=2 Tax=Mycoplasmopsis alligatoris TaxID=47687 RepID=D4XVE1_9BACT|nr:sialidase family protein [Mycoplasmopsis alligatoris]AAR98792.1 sialidase [Mycoplasmopsis alligatoris A21JP2]EFF41649.1 BNR/Asp-box repeat protein [Mycoplasmopsis alligatoris A21JP2]